jgi:uncharacterized protein (UPF0297 family)
MAQNKRKNVVEDAKNKSMKHKDFNSMNSLTGYQHTGNDAQVHAKAYAIRQSDNGSHM